MFHTDLTVPPFVAFFWEIYYSQLHKLCKLYRLYIDINVTVHFRFQIPKQSLENIYLFSDEQIHKFTTNIH